MNETGNLEIVIASDVDYAELNAEIYCGGKYVALLSQDDGIDKLKIVFPDASANQEAITRSVDLQWFRHALEGAEKVLIGEVGEQ